MTIGTGSEQADAEPRREGVQRDAVDDYRHEHALLVGGQAGVDQRRMAATIAVAWA